MQNNFTWYLKFHAGGPTIFSQVQLTVSRVPEFSWVSGISVFLWWLAYFAIMYMKLQFPRAWMPHTSCEISQIAGGSDPLRSLNFEICESEPYINYVILRIPLYGKFLMIVAPG